MKSKPNCRYCGSKTKLAWPGPGKNLLCCDRCLATCIRLADGQIIDWRPGRKTKGVMEALGKQAKDEAEARAIARACVGDGLKGL